MIREKQYTSERVISISQITPLVLTLLGISSEAMSFTWIVPPKRPTLFSMEKIILDTLKNLQSEFRDISVEGNAVIRKKKKRNKNRL